MMLQSKRVIAYRCHDGNIAEEPDALVCPMTNCGFLHVDHLLKIELQFADMVHHTQNHVDIAVSSTCEGSRDRIESR